MEEVRSKEDKLLIDDLLDTYNDYLTLYLLFEDQEFLEVAHSCLLVIKNLSKKKVKVRAQVKKLGVKGEA